MQIKIISAGKIGIFVKYAKIRLTFGLKIIIIDPVLSVIYSKACRSRQRLRT